jgi:hypothetical protein
MMSRPQMSQRGYSPVASIRRWPVIARVIVSISLLLLATGAHAAELLVVEDPRCGPCILFDRQIGPIYAKTDEGRVAPLHRIAYGKPAPAPYAFIGQPKVAPTFVLVDQGREVGRIEGYSSDELFWMSLASLIQKLPESP